jgi:beta-galactosidase
LAGFPTEGFSDWQWIDMVTNVKSVNINAQPRTLRPIVSAIDDWSRNDRLGVIFEAKVGRGKLLVCAVNILNPNRPTVRQLRRSLLDYMTAETFNPSVSLTPAQASALWPGPNAPPTSPITTRPGFNPGDVVEDPAALRGTPPRP